MRRTFAFIAAVCVWRMAACCFGWEISDFTTDIRIQPDSSIEVSETIVADFTGEPHHGIFRTIPVQYRDKYGDTLALRLKILSVTDETGAPCEFIESGMGRYRKIRIGNPRTHVTGLKTYRIAYHVERATAFFDDHDELYWNATGNEWPVAIRRATARVTLPAIVGSDKLHGLAFTGAYGTTTGDADIRTDAQGISCETRHTLRPLEGLTVVAGWPKGIVAPPTWNQQATWFLTDNWPLLLPLLTALGLTAWWYLFGRDPRGRGTIVVQYEPPTKLTPAEIGTVVDERCDMRDISATIIDLAVRGYLTIKEIKRDGLLHDKTDYQFAKLKEFRHDSALLPHEKLVLGGIFGIEDEFASLSSLEGDFYSQLPEIRDAVYGATVRHGFFTKDPHAIRLIYKFIGGAVVAVGVVGAVLQFITSATGPAMPWTLAGGLGVAASGVVIWLFAPILPRKTPSGAKLHEDILGFEEYLTRAERQELQASEQQNLFERLLPYAMALGVAGLWAKRFEGLALRLPSWYAGQYDGSFQPTMFTSRLGYAASSMNRSLSVAPRSTSGGLSGGGSSWSGGGSGFGGGFSGGGGGGGGGGAW